jgi:hypothetical protein
LKANGPCFGCGPVNSQLDSNPMQTVSNDRASDNSQSGFEGCPFFPGVA